MDRNREARRASIVGSNGFNRRRHRTNSLRNSPDEDGGVELQESVRLRERVKKERDRDRDRDRERERERDLRERSSRSKRRRAERLTSNREDIAGDETSDESVNDEDDDEDEESTTASAVAGSSVRLSTPPVVSVSNHLHHQAHVSNHHSSSFSQQQQHNSNINTTNNSNLVSGNSNHHLQHRKSFPPASASAKVFRAPPVWKSGDEMISSTVPRKARSASTKRSHDWISSSSNNNSGGAVAGGEQISGQTSGSPARQGLVSTTTTPLPPAPMSPSSSNVSMRKKLKPSVNQTGPKLKPPKVASKPSSSNPEELEIEIAEVLYGLMTQSQAPSSKKEDSREVSRSNTDAKSRNSSPISNSASTIIPPNSNSSSPLSAVAPKRKRPRQVPENSIPGGARRPDADQTPKTELSSPNQELKISRSEAENGGGVGVNTVISQAEIPRPAAPEPEPAKAAEEFGESRDLVAKEEVSSTVEKLSPATRAEERGNGDSAPPIATASSATTMIKAKLQSETQNQKEEKFEIDLMAPPPQARSSPEMENKIDSMTSAMDAKPVLLSTNELDLKPLISKNEENKKVNTGDDHSAEEKKSELSKTVENNNNKGRNNMNIDLKFHLEKPERDGSGCGINASTNKSQLQAQKQQPQQMPLKATREETHIEKSGHPTSSLPLPLSMASWPGGLPPMGYMAPLQGVVPIDGGATVTPAHLQPPFSLPRPKRCATHCHIARNILCLQQFMKMNPYLSAAHAASMFGSKPPGNLNIMPPTDLHGNLAVRGVSNNINITAQDSKGQQGIGGTANHAGKEKGSQSAASADSAQRKQQQILIQQAMPPVAPPSNLLGPAFIFPLNQPQTAPLARSSTAKSATTTGASPNPSSSAGTVPSSSAPTPPPMSFTYPNMSPNETQYLAILQNNPYPFPIPAAVGAPPPNYRGTPAQAMPLFNGSYYSSQMIHPSHLQQHTQQQPSSTAHNQNASPSSGSSSSHQKHLQQRLQSSGSGNASLQNFTSQKTQPSHNNNNSNQYMQGGGVEDNNQSTDSRGSRPTMNIYGQNFAMPIHPQSFALMTPSTTTASSNQSEKKGSHQMQTGLKSGVSADTPLPPHSFAMSFGPINGADMAACMAQSHAAMFQNSPEATRQNIQMMAAAAAQVAQKKSTFRVSEDSKSGGGADAQKKSTFRVSEDSKSGGGADSPSSKDDDRKSFAGMSNIAFARSDLPDGPATAASSQPNSSGGGPSRASRPGSNAGVGPTNMIPNAHFQAHQQQMMQLKQQHQQQLAAASRSKMAAEHLMSNSSSSPSAMAKFPNSLSGFPQNLVQVGTNNSATTTPRRDKSPPKWKRSSSASQATPSALATSAGPPITNLLQHMQMQPNNRPAQPQMHGQISFGGNNQKQPTASGGGQAPPPSSVGSPTTSSISKGGGGSPITTSSASTNNGKMGQAQSSSLSPQPTKNSPSINPSQKSPSILGNPHNISSSSSNSAAKTTQMQQQQSQLPKSMQHAQLFFSNPYNQSQSSPHTAGPNSTNLGSNGYYMTTRRRPDSAGTNTNDPAIAIANATSNVKGGGFSSQGMIHASQLGGPGGGPLLHSGYSYVHPVPAAVQVKPAEQKQTTGNENLHTWQPEKK